MLTTVFFLVFVAFPLVVYGQTNYCTTLGKNHTMCKYKANACTKSNFVNGVSAADKTAVLKAHNDLRSKVASGKQPGQPSATNMKQLVWDTELETIAQRWDDQCSFGHDTNRNSARFYCGQNVAITMSSQSGNKANFTEPVYMWYNEVTNPGFNPKNINPFVSTSGTGHYTQLVWADTKYIGCGYAYYKEGSWYNKLYVCNYGPGGNVINGVMYKTGPTASACTSGKSITYPSLCN